MINPELQSLKEKCNSYLSSGDHKTLQSLLIDNKNLLSISTELSYLYYFSMLIPDNLRMYDHVGLIFSFSNVKGFYFFIKELKKILHRICYIDNYFFPGFKDLMKQYHMTPVDLNWLIRASVSNPDKTIQKLFSSPEANSSDNSNTIVAPPIILNNEITVCFIICSNDDELLDETIYYIERLFVPVGVTKQILSIKDAKSMCSGYQEGMTYSDAKYKVYLHHDVRIINRCFIYDMLRIFTENKRIGLIGMVGCKTLPLDGIMWHADRFGCVLETHIHETVISKNYLNNDQFMSVSLCDGFLLATQYDLPWREDIFTGWDFYDASACLEFIRAGYDIAVPYQNSPWCLHDCGYNDLSDYDQYREAFLSEYSDFLR